jgi:hypothetical protein
MDSVIHLSSELYIHIISSLYCAKLFSTTAYTGCVQWAFNSNYDLPVNKLRILKITFLCVLQVNDARLDPTMVSRIDSKVVNRHWSWTVSPHVTRS